jgi:all-trans-retinol 13,14-reductase
VSYKKTFDKNEQTNETFAKNIITNTAVPNVVNLLPKKEQVDLNKKIKNLKKSCSLLTIYIGFKKDIKELGNKYYSTFIVDNETKKLESFSKNAKSDYTTRGFTFVDYSQIDSALTPKGKTLGAIVTIDYLTNWENLTQNEYKKKKEKIAKIFFKRLEKHIPRITKEIEHYEVGTPKTIQRYTLNPEGSVYGFAQTPKQA